MLSLSQAKPHAPWEQHRTVEQSVRTGKLVGGQRGPELQFQQRDDAPDGWAPVGSIHWRDAFRLEASGRFTDGIPVQNNSLCFPLFKPENVASANLYEELDRVMASLKKLADRLRLEAGGTLSKSPCRRQRTLRILPAPNGARVRRNRRTLTALGPYLCPCIRRPYRVTVHRMRFMPVVRCGPPPSLDLAGPI